MVRATWRTIIVVLLAGLFTLTESYLAIVSSDVPAGTIIFEAGVPQLGGRRSYRVSEDRTARFARKLLRVDPRNGRVSLARSLDCDRVRYPRLFTFYVDSTSTRLGRPIIDYYSLPLRVLITGCGGEREDLAATNGWTAETLASYAMPSNEQRFTEICLRTSQFVASLRDFLPETAIKDCEAHWGGVADSRFLIEGAGGDLVSSSEQCLVEPLWKVTVSVRLLRCVPREGAGLLREDFRHGSTTEHRLKIIFHHQQLDDTDLGRRVRRELRNKSPFFEHGLYIAAVEEEKEPGEPVTVVRAKDPEGGPLRYTMMSLLDARSSALFALDSQTGRVTTRARLDRENVEVHYFKILAVDEAFPPRSGTTTLQVNVLDANDHAPVFELADYEAPIREGVPIGSSVVAVKATDLDFGRNAEVEYSIVSTSDDDDTVAATTVGDDSPIFRIDPRSGVVTTRICLDREKTEVYTVTISATDLANAPAERRTATTSLVVRILDDNDNYPQFSERSYSASLPEDLDYTSNPIIASIRASDADSGTNAVVRYTIIGGNTQNTFAIDSPSGDVILVKSLDFETTDLYRIVVRAQDGGSPTRSNTTQLIVRVKDVNDNAPRFFTSLLQEAVSESVPIGTSIIRVQAYDGDKGLNALVKYSIGARDLSGASTEHLPIMVDPDTGWILATGQLDREECSRYQLIVVASDSGEPAKSSSATVLLTVTDVNDNDPRFEPKNYEALVSEDDPPGTRVASVTATDPDEDAKIRYEITAGNTRARFSVTSQNGGGLITIAQPLDYKQEKRFVLTLTAADSGGRTDTALVYVNVTDANNFAPVFENAPYSVAVFEDAPVGTTVLVVSATDSDVGQNARITYSLGSEGNENDDDDDDDEQTQRYVAEFTINSQTGAITTAKRLDREKLSGYVLTVTARDGGIPPLSDTTEVEISVSDVNDNAPVFDAPRYEGSVLEDVVVGTSVSRVSASDADQALNGRVRYTFEEDGDGAFAIDPTTGTVRTAKQLDRESVARYNLRALAIDRGIPALSTTVTVVVDIEDVNDSPPSFESDKIVVFVAENCPIGSSIGDIYAHDPDEGANAAVQYSIIGGEDASSFALNARPGSDRAELTTREELDYESPRKKFEIFVRASSPPLRSDVLVQIMVTDVNDNAPVLKDFHVIFNNFKDFFPSTPIGRIPAFDADVTDNLVYGILSGNSANLVTLNASNGEISLSPQLNTNVPRVATMEVSASDGVNEIKASMTLYVRLVTDKMLLNSITVRLDDMTVEAFLSPLLGYFVDGLAAIIPCPRENIFVFSVLEDTEVNAKILNVSFSAKKVEPGNNDEFYSPQFLQERVYLNRGILARLAVVTVLPFDDNLCVREPCLNFAECVTVLKFANASGFASSDTVLFRPIYPVTTFSCECPRGFTGSREAYLCDTEVNLCYSNPCRNGGSCERREAGYTCVCRPDFTGPNCEVSLSSAATEDVCSKNVCAGGSRCTIGPNGPAFTCEACPIKAVPIESSLTAFCELRSRSFVPTTFLTFASLRQRHRLRLELKFATESRDGLLLYNGRYNEKHDFIALEITDARVQFSFSLGDEITRAIASIPGGVSDGRWHEVKVSYVNRTVVVSLDDCDVALALEHGERLGEDWSCAARSEQILETRCSHPTETCHRFLDLTGPLQVGGLPSIPSSFRVRNKHFVGCLRDLRIDGRFVDFDSYVADNGTTAGCPEKRAFCAETDRACLNGGTCREIWSGYVCECAEGFAGPRCTDEVGKPWRFRGNGILSFNPLLRPILLPWTTALSLRTRREAAFVMSIQIGQNSSVLVYLEGGKLVASLDGAKVIATPVTINDGDWHRVEIVWQTGHVTLGMDYRNRPFASSNLLAKLQGLFVGRILLGGPDLPPGLTPVLDTELEFFDGCVQDLRIGTNQSVLQRPTLRENVDNGCPTDDECASADCPESSVCRAKWRASECVCNAGRVGRDCLPICDVDPCRGNGDDAAVAGGTCVPDALSKKGYRCECTSDEYSGEYCEVRVDQPCPATWWGTPVCGPCHCDETKGYDPSCNKTTGECYCKENHYQPSAREECIPCDCYAIGSYGGRCDTETGQCRCRTGVIGRSCTSCPNPYAEVTEDGCRVVYDGCPRDFSMGIWWPRTKFGATALEDCPGTAVGKSWRSCDDYLSGWQPPDLFNCTSEAFIEQRYKLAAIEDDRLRLDRDVAVKMALDLHRAVNQTRRNMYGADVLVAESLLIALLRYEESLADLGLTHNQDKDYVPRLVAVAGALLAKKHLDKWQKIQRLNGDSPDKILDAMARYLKILTGSQHDTFTEPFEVVDTNVVMGLDTVTSESLFGYESPESGDSPPDPTSVSSTAPRPTEADRRVVIPDTSSFLVTSPPQFGPYVTFPKYNNYMADPQRFDPYSKIRVPLSLLGIEALGQGQLNDNETPRNNEKAVLSYVQYKELGAILPKRFDDSVNVRWGVEVAVGSPVVTVSILVPTDDNSTKSSLSAGMNNFQSPVQIQLWIIEEDGVKIRANPQCVHWSTVRGTGEWSRIGCTTEIDDVTVDGRRMVNCSCQGLILQVRNLQLATFAVLTDVLDLEYVPEPSLLEDVASYSAFMLALPLLLTALLILALIRGGGGTNSNSIHENLVFCVFVAETLYLVALKARGPLVSNVFPCKLTAIGLHYAWLSTFAWTLVDSIHLYRMLTEMRDVNHGQMRFYYTIGYGLPAVIVGLTIGVRADQYGNFYFCWLSIYETVVWALIGPVCAAVLVNFSILVMSVRAAFTLKEHIMGFGNLRTLLWLSVASLPLLGTTWTLAVLNASENSPILSYLLSVSVLAHAAFSLIGYCFVNGRVRRNLYLGLLRCVGKKSPLLEGSTGNASSSQNVNGQSRSALAYSSAYSGADSNTCRRVHVGVSTSSTTSRSTTKTGSSPYRSDAHLRHTSTSTSNYNSDRDPYVSSRSHHGGTRLNSRQGKETHRGGGGSGGRDSESDSEVSRAEDGDGRGGGGGGGGGGIGGPSLDLASSHSSDDEDVTARSHKNIGVSTQQPISHSYLPNIHGNPVGNLNILCSNSELFPNIKPIYAPRWSSQLPEAYLPSNGDIRTSQWSGGTISDNEIASNKTSSPNPLPYPDMSPPQKRHQLDDNCSESEEKHHHEKYLFPYTAEEDHAVSPTPYLLSSRILGSSMSHHSQNSNHDNHSGSERYGSLKRGQSLQGASHHDNLAASERYGSLKRGKITLSILEDAPEYILPMSGRILASSLNHDLHHSNELAALRQQQQQQQQQQHYEQTITETEKDTNAETPV